MLQGQVYPLCVTSIHESQISSISLLRPAVVELHAILRQVHWMTPKSPWILQGQMYPIHALQVSTRPIFHSVSRYDEPFLSYRPFWEKCTKWPQNDLKLYKVKYTPYMCYKYPRGVNFTVSLYDKSFSSYWPFWEKCTKLPQSDLEHYKLKCSPHVLIVSMIPKFHSVSLYNQPFLRYRAFWDKCTEWPQNDLEPYKVKLPYLCITNVRNSQISLRFALRPALFEIQTILRQVHRMTAKWPWTLQGQITLPMYN